jgi:hypothetical protein
VLISKDDRLRDPILQDSFGWTAMGAAGKLPSRLPAESLQGAMVENSRAIREWRAFCRTSLSNRFGLPDALNEVLCYKDPPT